MPYEYHKYEHYSDPTLKIIFHKDIIKNGNNNSAHWHKSPELLLIIEGKLMVICDGVERIYEKDEIAIINNNQIHDIRSLTEECTYYCLIIDTDIYDIKINEFPEKSNSKEAVRTYTNIVDELQMRKINYKEAVIGYSKVLLTLISREKIENAESEPNISRKAKLVKAATQYIYENFSRDISLEEISDYLNTSKYYLSHIFKEINGKTIITHINFVRCKHAKSMLKSGNYNVAESAYASGFSNLSYFSKTYKNIIGNSPIKDLKANK